MSLADQDARDRFVRGRGQNISVIAPAGVGKTTAIVARIVDLARGPEQGAIETLSRLIVVTYSVRAAQEMQHRARQAIIAEKSLSPRVRRAFQQVFFGTIHSYCVRLLDRFGHLLGVPQPIRLLEDEEKFWNRFLSRGARRTTSLAQLAPLFAFYTPGLLYQLGRQLSPGEANDPGPAPVPDFADVLSFQDSTLHRATLATVQKAQLRLAEWREAWLRGKYEAPPGWPQSDKAEAFAQRCRAALTPLLTWARDAAAYFGRQISTEYADFRMAQGVMTYDDQVRLALRVLDHPTAQEELAGEGISVLLDEAQDTDPRQFEVLLRLAGLAGKGVQASHQTFSVVGDFQQAIYVPRSDLSVYQRVHGEISLAPRGTTSSLHVTFRCDRAIIDFVNRIFPSILEGRNGQSAFVPLYPRDQAGEGQVVRWFCPDEDRRQAGETISAAARARHEADFLAREIQERGPHGLGAKDWSEVAILCPRRNWLRMIARELVARGLPVQLYSADEKLSENTPASWLAALTWIASRPEDSFEIAGVLREIFGVSDHDMALFTDGHGDRLRLDREPVPGSTGPVSRALQTLRAAFTQAEELPLHQFIGRMIDQVGLRARLLSIAEFAEENMEEGLDHALSLVFDRCAQGTTLHELAEALRLGLEQSSPGEEKRRNAIQLLTSHKAKGLEWQTVIVPYLFRRIESKQAAYPRIVQHAGGEERVYRDREDFASEVDEFVTLRDRQQLQRLLYVTCTRPKTTLLLIDDEELFADAPYRRGWSSATLLDLQGDANREAWESLPRILKSCAESGALASPFNTGDSLPSVSPSQLDQAVQRAQEIPLRITPHALAIHPSADREPERQMESEENRLTAGEGNSAGILYGTWWHEFVQTLPWQDPPSAWDALFEKAVQTSPDPVRSRHEWTLFIQSSLCQWLAKPGRLVQCEIPFLWPDGSRCMEGVIDLAVHTEDGWKIIDWKTNRVGPGGASSIVEIYREQVRAYGQVLRHIFGGQVEGSLYLTATGEWLEVLP